VKKIKRSLALFAVLFLICAIFFDALSGYKIGKVVQASEAPLKDWEVSYGTLTEDEEGRSVIQTSDGGYLMAGQRFGYPGPPTGYDAILVKVDSNGAVEWSKIIGDDATLDTDVVACAVVEANDGYVFAGTWEHSNFWLYKAHLDGTLSWYEVFAGPYDDQYNDELDKCECMIQTSDGGFVLGGRGGYGVSAPHGWLMKTGSDIWSKTFTYPVAIYSVVETNDGGLAFGGPGSIYPQGYFVKTDSSGSQQWIRTVHFAVDSVIQTSDGGYALAGEGTGQEAGDWFLVKTDSSGHWQWNQTNYGGKDLTSMIQTSDGGYVMVGSGPGYHPMEPQPEDDWLIMKTDSNGVWEWSIPPDHMYGSGTTDDKAYSVIETSDGGLAITGFLYKNAGLIKLGSNINQPPTADSISGPSSGNINVEYTWTTTGSDPDGDAITYEWYVDGVYKSGGSDFSYTFGSGDTLGNHEIKVRVKDSNNAYSNYQTLTFNLFSGVRISAWSVPGWAELPITMDGSDSGFNTPHTFEGLTGTHTFTLPEAANGYLFTEWIKDNVTFATTRTISVDSDGIYTAQYTGEPPTAPTEQANFEVPWGEEVFVVETLSNSTVADVVFNQTDKFLSFTVNGTSGTVGFCNISIPQELMDGEFEISMDGTQLNAGVGYSESYNGTHHLFAINYEHSSHAMKITSTIVIPDFAAWLFLPFVMLVTLSAIIISRYGKWKNLI
jgi:hypothetical protein